MRFFDHVQFLLVDKLCIDRYLFLRIPCCLYVIQHSMAVHMVLILDGISPGLTHQGILWTHSGVQVEWIPEVHVCVWHYMILNNNLMHCSNWRQFRNYTVCLQAMLLDCVWEMVTGQNQMSWNVNHWNFFEFV